MLKYILLTFLFLPVFAQAQTVVVEDENLKQCFLDHYPQLLDTDSTLIIAQANNFAPEIICIDRSIQSLQGLEYFTNLELLNVKNNLLTQVNEIQNLKKIKSLLIYENKITSLPSLDSLVILEDLDIRRNQLTELPTLSNNLELIKLNAHTNNITNLPDLSMLTKLKYLNFTYNTNLTEPIPGFEKLVSLEIFHCWFCGLENLSPLETLTELRELKVDYNQLTSLPNLDNNDKLSIIYANDNQLSSLPNFNSNPNLSLARLYNNPLNISDVLPLINHSNDYSTIFKVAPLDTVALFIPSNWSEGDLLDLRIEKGINDDSTTFTWYKDDKVIWTGTKDNFKIDSLKTDDAGEYRAEITTTWFPTLKIVTYPEIIKVFPKTNPDEDKCKPTPVFEIQNTPAYCNTKGQIKISNTDSNFPQHQFRITNEKTDVVFKEMTEIEPGIYTIHIDYELCTDTIGRVEIGIVHCEEEPHLSPNNDGVSDFYYFNEESNIEIFDKYGRSIIEFQGPYEWDGRNGNGESLSPGYYTISINKGEKITHITLVY